MKKITLIIIIILLNFTIKVFANEINCNDFKKFSVEYLKCKGNLIKNKTISGSKNIIKDTKEYQNKEWSEEKGKIEKAKDKINKAKERF